MRHVFYFFVFLCFSCSKANVNPSSEPPLDENAVNFLQSSEIQLSSPVVRIDSTLFDESANVSFELALDKVQIKYCFDDQVVRSYSEPFEISSTQKLKVWAEKDGFLNSPELQFQLVKLRKDANVSKISLSPQAHESYPGLGETTLVDRQKGTLDFKSDNSWLGFQTDVLELDVELAEETIVNEIYLSVLSDPNAWIFRPLQISVYIDGRMEGSTHLPETESSEKAQMEMISVRLKQSRETQSIRLVIENMPAIPEWHSGKGMTPWLFLDEIIIQ